jgi:carboxyl-terminal processing protease
MVPGTSVAHVLLSQFHERTTTQRIEVLGAAQAQGATSIILDLRNNGGGVRDEAVGAASQFLDDGLVLVQRNAGDERTEFPVQPDGVALDVPLVVLINEGTASAGEIVAGALLDHARAPLIGQKTAGYGTVLSTFTLSDGSAVLIGTEEWLTPSGSRIWHTGVQPTIPVTLPVGVAPLTPNDTAKLSPTELRETRDAQLRAALERLAPLPSTSAANAG